MHGLAKYHPYYNDQHLVLLDVLEHIVLEHIDIRGFPFVLELPLQSNLRVDGLSQLIHLEMGFGTCLHR
jgi:hypothetical protein